MTVEEAIEHCEEVAAREEGRGGCRECAEEHRQLAEWLRELRALRARQTPAKLDWMLWVG